MQKWWVRKSSPWDPWWRRFLDRVGKTSPWDPWYRMKCSNVFRDTRTYWNRCPHFLAVSQKRVTEEARVDNKKRIRVLQNFIDQLTLEFVRRGNLRTHVDRSNSLHCYTRAKLWGFHATAWKRRHDVWRHFETFGFCQPVGFITS